MLIGIGNLPQTSILRLLIQSNVMGELAGGGHPIGFRWKFKNNFVFKSMNILCNNTQQINTPIKINKHRHCKGRV